MVTITRLPSGIYSLMGDNDDDDEDEDISVMQHMKQKCMFTNRFMLMQHLVHFHHQA